MSEMTAEYLAEKLDIPVKQAADVIAASDLRALIRKRLEGPVHELGGLIRSLSDVQYSMLLQGAEKEVRQGADDTGTMILALVERAVQ